MQSDWIIPLPPDTEATAARGDMKKVIGLYPCINAGQCDQFILVKVDNKGCPYGTCSPLEVNIRGCRKRSVKGAPEDIPAQTYEAYQTALETVQGMTEIPDSYTRYLTAEWDRFNKQEAQHANISTQAYA